MKNLKALLELRVLVATHFTLCAWHERPGGSMWTKAFLFIMLAVPLGAATAFALDAAGPQDARIVATTPLPSTLSHPARQASFGQERASRDARYVADWAVDANDNQGLPFVIVDKADAKVYVFYADGRLRGAASVLLGLAVGDDSVPGIGQRKLASIRPEERTTPAGRFVADLDHNLHGKEMLWVDYEAAISLHPVVTNNARERRAERLASPSVLDKRISYGCINVPANFFRTVVSPAFKGTTGIVYVLPETRSARQVFASYDVDERARLQTASQGLPAQVTAAAALH